METTHADAYEVQRRVNHVLATRGPEVRELVRNCVADVLNLEPAAVAPEALLTELGAESIDHLDLVFRLETAFRVKIPRGGIRQAAQAGMDGQFEVGGRLSDVAIERLRILMPEIPRERLSPGLKANEISSLFTVETFVRLTAWQLAEQQS